MKLLQAVIKVLEFIKMLREALVDFIDEAALDDIIDYGIDIIEKNNVGKHPEYVVACKFVRKIIGVPDDDIDEENPI